MSKMVGCNDDSDKAQELKREKEQRCNGDQAHAD